MFIDWILRKFHFARTHHEMAKKQKMK